MNKIRTLSPTLVSKIAAGEVIERPSFAVKELLENAIDAKATEIKIYLEDAGLKKILIVDNGEGMSPTDVRESWKPHTTSKLSEEHELHRIKSLGFRGEALSSLAAVSTITIQSRRAENPIGFAVTIHEGELQKSSEVGMPKGTSVLVDHLFSSLPGRKKFLKSTSVELRHSIDVVNHMALAYPHIHFTLTHGKKTLIDYPKTERIADRVEQVLGEDTTALFIPLTKSESYVSIQGFIAKPQLNSTAQNKQYLYINARKVTDKRIAAAVKEAYGTMLESTAYPLFVLFVTIPFEMVDVNVHPRKEHVQFLNNQFVFQTTKSAVSTVLTENNLTFENLSWKREGVGLSNSFAGKELKRTVLDAESFSGDTKAMVLQFNNLYIVVTHKADLFLVDQHAAHERILFEKLKKEFLTQKAKKMQHTLLKPIVIKLSVSERLLLQEHTDFLESIGYSFHDERLTHVPFIFQDRDPKKLLMQLLEDLDSGKTNPVDRASEEMLAFLACRAAVKAGDTLTEAQMKKILIDLETTSNNATCPHGRPTRIVISEKQLDTLFKR